MHNKTLALIKPEVIKLRRLGQVITAIEQAGFTIVFGKIMTMNPAQAAAFYDEHRNRDFFPRLINDITRGPIMAMILQKDDEDVVKAWRTTIGATNPEEAAEGTIRRQFGLSRRENIVHGADSPDSALREAGLLFPMEVEMLLRNN